MDKLKRCHRTVSTWLPDSWIALFARRLHWHGFFLALSYQPAMDRKKTQAFGPLRRLTVLSHLSIRRVNYISNTYPHYI